MRNSCFPFARYFSLNEMFQKIEQFSTFQLHPIRHQERKVFKVNITTANSSTFADLHRLGPIVITGTGALDTRHRERMNSVLNMAIEKTIRDARSQD